MEKVDFKILRAFPYALFTMFMSIMLSMAGLLIEIALSGSVADTSLYQMNSNVSMICYFFMYVSIVLLMCFLYEMYRISKWFNYACIMTKYFILSETMDFVTRWAVRYVNNVYIKTPLVVITEIIPSLCILLLLIFIMEGIVEIYKKMDKEKKAEKCIKFRKFCIMAFILQILLSAAVGISASMSEIYWLFIALAVVAYLFNLTIIILLYVMVKEFSYNYYMYSYNSGR